MIEGNKKSMNKVIPLNIPLIAKGEFIILEDPVVAVMESKIPALTAAINPEIKIKTAAKT